jgi:hypothetical protein
LTECIRKRFNFPGEKNVNRLWCKNVTNGKEQKLKENYSVKGSKAQKKELKKLKF